MSSTVSPPSVYVFWGVLVSSLGGLGASTASLIVCHWIGFTCPIKPKNDFEEDLKKACGFAAAWTACGIFSVVSGFLILLVFIALSEWLITFRIALRGSICLLKLSTICAFSFCLATYSVEPSVSDAYVNLADLLSSKGRIIVPSLQGAGSAFFILMSVLLFCDIHRRKLQHRSTQAESVAFRTRGPIALVVPRAKKHGSYSFSTSPVSGTSLSRTEAPSERRPSRTQDMLHVHRAPPAAVPFIKVPSTQSGFSRHAHVFRVNQDITRGNISRYEASLGDPDRDRIAHDA